MERGFLHLGPWLLGVGCNFPLQGSEMAPTSIFTLHIEIPQASRPSLSGKFVLNQLWVQKSLGKALQTCVAANCPFPWDKGLKGKPQNFFSHLLVSCVGLWDVRTCSGCPDARGGCEELSLAVLLSSRSSVSFQGKQQQGVNMDLSWVATVVGAGLGCSASKSKGQGLLNHIYTSEKAIARVCVCRWTFIL